jgi:hypothetical protein
MKEKPMKRLFSVVIVLFFLAAIGFAGTTIWFGMQTEKQYHHILGRASEYGYIQLTNESYDRGFLARVPVKDDKSTWESPWFMR